ncbi:MAG: sigma-70 family RNA polymerase sigma factor [Anaerolineae bacterium]|nr:sigma-70 family RNA polymerase sigma factor [Anaerolineae bacterium]
MDSQPLNPGREWELVEKARRDPQAFKQLYNHYFPRLYAYVSYRVGRTQDAEDLVAETFLKVVEGIGRFEWRHEGSFAAWLFRIAHNLIGNFYRRSQRREESLPLEELPELQDNTLLPEDAILQKEKFAYLRRLIGTLSPRRQEVITLKFFGGLRNQEIAEVLELDERTVASHLCRGLEDLHRRYVGEFVQTKEGIPNERAKRID